MSKTKKAKAKPVAETVTHSDEMFILESANWDTPSRMDTTALSDCLRNEYLFVIADSFIKVTPALDNLEDVVTQHFTDESGRVCLYKLNIETSVTVTPVEMYDVTVPEPVLPQTTVKKVPL